MHLALGHVRDDQPVGHLGRHHAKGEDVVRGVSGKHLLGGLLGDDERGNDDQAKGNDWRDDARALWGNG